MTDRDVRRQRLAEITDVILDGNSHPGVLLHACNELRDIFLDITGVGGDNPESAADRDDLLLESGKAISPWGAGRCVTEFSRTAKYLRGLHDGISDAIREHKGRPVSVLYAGCGPYAALAVPLMNRFSPGSVQFTLLEINGRSLHAARRIIEELRYEDFVSGFVQCDATTYRHPAGRPFHVIVTETMLRALEVEPQAAITLNLADQLCAGGIFIPRRIVIDACLANVGNEFTTYPAGAEISEEDLKNPARNRRRLLLGRLIDFTAESAVALRDKVVADGAGRSFFPPVTVKIPPDAAPDLNKVMLLTNVDVYGPHCMGDYESSITNTLQLKFPGRPANGSEIEFRYVMGKRPGFEWGVIQ